MRRPDHRHHYFLHGVGRRGVIQSFEDFAADDTHKFGAHDVTETEMLELAEQCDPQWFHTDPEHTESELMYGGAITNGWHTTAMTMRLLVDGFLGDSAALGAKGVGELHWQKSVYPGGMLVMKNEVLEITVKTDSHDLVKIRTTTRAERESREVEEVCPFVNYVVFARRDDDAE